MTRRVLHFTDEGDTSGFFPQLAKWHDRDRYTMMLGTLRPMAAGLRDMMRACAVSTVSLECRSRRDYPAAILRMAGILRRHAIDVLHTHLFDPSVVGLLSAAVARTPRRVMTRHYSDYHTRIHKSWHVRLDRLATHLSDAVIAVSQHTAEHLVSVEHAPPAKVHVVWNGIDFERVRLSSADAPQRLRRQYASHGEALLLVAARLHPEKGYEYLFDALPELRRQYPDVRLLVAGTGTFEREYRARVAALGCGDWVTFLGFRQDLPDLMAAADLFVLPSVAEAFGLVLAEALYLGTPVVATRVGGIPEIIRDGVDGVLIPPADSQAIATTIAGLLKDDARRNAMRGRGCDAVVSRFGFERMLKAYEALYDELLAR